MKRSSEILVIGLIYLILYKILFAFFPNLNDVPFIYIVRILSILATSSILIWIIAFLRRYKPKNKNLKFILIAILTCTSIIILIRITNLTMSEYAGTKKLIFGVFSKLNALLILLFLWLSMKKINTGSSKLLTALKAGFWAMLITICIYIIIAIVNPFIFKTLEHYPSNVFQYIYILLYIFTSSILTWFIIEFKKESEDLSFT